MTIQGEQVGNSRIMLANCGCGGLNLRITSDNKHLKSVF